MKYKVFGIEPREYKNKAGKTVKGVNLYCGYEKNGVDGFAFDKDCRFWLSDATYKNAMLYAGDVVDITFNRWGGIDGISAC